MQWEEILKRKSQVQHDLSNPHTYPCKKVEIRVVTPRPLASGMDGWLVGWMTKIRWTKWIRRGRTFTYIYVCVCMRVLICVYVCVNVYIAFIYIYTDTHIGVRVLSFIGHGIRTLLYAQPYRITDSAGVAQQ